MAVAEEVVAGILQKMGEHICSTLETLFQQGKVQANQLSTKFLQSVAFPLGWEQRVKEAVPEIRSAYRGGPLTEKGQTTDQVLQVV
jgi:hypothetical protein